MDIGEPVREGEIPAPIEIEEPSEARPGSAPEEPAPPAPVQPDLEPAR